MSNNNAPLKIAVCGPVRGGKTSIANFLAGQTEHIGNVNKIYEATCGIIALINLNRILECEKQPGITGDKVPVEIWDVSGDQAFESCWPAIMKGVDGVVLVYNPEIPTHDIEVGIWYDQFVKRAKLDNRQCQVIAHRASPTPAPRSRLPPKLASLSGNILYTNFSSVSQVITGFEDFLREVHHHAAMRAQQQRK
ncbi:unnamed protein product [Scytosiphon promiscuus]